MNKKTYLEELKDILEDHNVSQDDVTDILNDYEQMYTDGIDKSMSDQEIIDLLGEPEDVYEDLKDTVSFIIRKTKSDHKFVAISPFIALITFFAIGMYTGIWHPTWLVFLLIPVAGVLSGGLKRDTLVALSPFVALITFILVTHFYGAYEFAWLVFLLIPILGFLAKPSLKSMIMIFSILIAVAFYLYLYIVQGEFYIGLLGFLLPLVLSVIFGYIKIVANWDTSRKGLAILLSLATLLIIFILMGLYLPNGWAYSWQVLLLFPVSVIIFSGEFKLVAIMPFISTIIFYSLGYFFDMFAISWLAFLLIPMVAILSGDE